jgi:hypothetical protein
MHRGRNGSARSCIMYMTRDGKINLNGDLRQEDLQW